MSPTQTAPVQHPRILVVEDEPDLCGTLDDLLQNAGYRTSVAMSVMQANHLLRAQAAPDMILLDWMLPGMSGLRWLRQLRRTGSRPAVILLTARTADEDKEQGLAADIDDYIAKPFSNRELLARIAAVLRRRRCDSRQTTLQIGKLVLDTAACTAAYAGTPIALNRREFALLHFFACNPNRAHWRQALLRRVWGGDSKTGERSVDVHVLWIRKKLMVYSMQDCIQTVWGVGYRFVPPQAVATRSA